MGRCPCILVISQAAAQATAAAVALLNTEVSRIPYANHHDISLIDFETGPWDDNQQ